MVKMGKGKNPHWLVLTNQEKATGIEIPILTNQETETSVEISILTNQETV